MKTTFLSFLLSCSFTAWAADGSSATYQSSDAPPLAPIPASDATPAPPPSAPPKRSAEDLEKLVAPIALYADSLIATMLPASVYPLEIVQAARFVADTNNLAKLDAQPWDENVKAVARVPAAIKKLNDDLTWTMELGDAFLAQDKEVMDAIQSMRGKAQKAGTLQTTPQQIVTVTNLIAEKTVEQKVVVVTNTVVQIQPSNPQVVYVPTYNPYTVYYPPPAYVPNPMAPLVTFGVGMMVGAAIANNNCNWNNGGCYHGSGNVNINGDVNINTGNINSGNRSSASASSQKWQPDQSRMAKSGSPSGSAQSAQARGYSASPSTASAGARSSTGTAGARPTTASAGARPATGTSATSRPTASPSASRPSPSASPAASRPAPSNSAFSGGSSGANTRADSSRGSTSRSNSGGGGGRSGGGGRR